MMAASNGLQDAHPYSQSDQPRNSSSPQPQHRRGYQACDPCRKRKVKCDLGSKSSSCDATPIWLKAREANLVPTPLGVDNPRAPPCVRCRRESKRCEFSATRRKRKLSEPENPVEGVLQRDKRMMVGEVLANESSDSAASYLKPDPATFENDGTPSLPKWSEASSSTASQLPPQSTVTQKYNAPGTSTPTSQFQDAKNLRLRMFPVGERASGTGYALEGGPPMMNRTAVELLSPAISNSHDALHLLSEAAGRTEDLNRQSLENRYAARQSVSSFNSPISPITQAGTPQSVGGSFSRAPRSGPLPAGNYYPTNTSDTVDPRLSHTRPQSGASGNVQDAGYLDAVRAWSRLRFVRAGWLSVEESMDYVA